MMFVKGMHVSLSANAYLSRKGVIHEVLKECAVLLQACKMLQHGTLSTGDKNQKITWNES
jgi:hypothetical protein